jgi:Protein of unknown function (DUF3152)
VSEAAQPVSSHAAVNSGRRATLALIITVPFILVIAVAFLTLRQGSGALHPAPAVTINAPAPIRVPQTGSGVLVTVPGNMKAPGKGRLVRVRVQIEEGLAAAIRHEPVAFANAVLTTLNDGRSWGRRSKITFSRTDGPADVSVALVTPATADKKCRPMRTLGKLSCRAGPYAVLNAYRWIAATPEFTDLALYRHYLVNHEVGHVLGYHHQDCPGAGRLAPVMQQQTKQVAPCLPNAWP